MKKIFLFFLVLGCLFGLVGLCPPALAGLQDMINAASDGGTVTISAGTFNESLTIDKNLTLRGVSSATSILQPGAVGQRVITVKAAIISPLKI